MPTSPKRLTLVVGQKLNEKSQFMKLLNLAIRMTTLAVTVILIATGCSKQNPSTESKAVVPEAKAKPPVLIEPNMGVDGAQKGMNKNQVRAALGKPGKINGITWFYRRRGMFISFGDDGVIFNIKCVKPFAGTTKEGIGIGSTRAELVAAYGNPSEIQQFEHGDENLWFAPLGTSFYLENHKVTSIIVQMNLK
jgi:hypothetical protein